MVKICIELDIVNVEFLLKFDISNIKFKKQDILLNILKNNYFAIYFKNKRYLFLFLDIHCHCHLGFFLGLIVKAHLAVLMSIAIAREERRKERNEGVVMRIQVQIRGLKMSSRFKGELGFSRFSFTFYLSQESLGQSSQYINWGKHRSDPHPSLHLVCSLLSLFIAFLLLFAG